jgi:hypothetical protein
MPRLNLSKIEQLRATKKPAKKLSYVHTRIPSDWEKKIEKRAKELTGGNVSEFLRCAIEVQL